MLIAKWWPIPNLEFNDIITKPSKIKKKNVEQPSLNLTFHQCSQPSNVHPANLVAFFQSSPRPKPSRRCRHPRHTTQRWGRDNRTPPDCHDPPRHGPMDGRDLDGNESWVLEGARWCKRRNWIRDWYVLIFKMYCNYICINRDPSMR